MDLNVIGNYKSRKILYDISFKDFIEMMKDPGFSQKKIVEKARTLDKDSVEYAEIKATLPCIVFNFNHSTSVRGNTVTRPTGFLYLDVDNEEVPEDLKDHPLVHGLWKTLSSKGYAVVVKVEGLNKDNLKSLSKSVAETLDIPYDTKAVSIDRLHVIGYDEDIYYNENSITFSYKESNESVVSLPLYVSNKRIEGGATNKLRFNNLQDVVNSMDLEFNGEVSLDFKDNKNLF